MGVRLMLAVATAMFIGIPSVQAARLYKWIDKGGNVSYHDRPPFEAGYRVEEKDIGTRSHAVSSVPQEVIDKFPVVLYSASRCSSCDSARTYLKSRGIPFTEKNVEGDRKLQEELIQQAGGLAVPTIIVGSKILKGYLESLLEGELDDAGYPKAGAAERTESEEPEKPGS
jgi:glutaredoxin